MKWYSTGLHTGIMRWKGLLICLNLLPATIFGQKGIPQVVSGRIDRIEHFQSQYTSPRTLDVWLPDGYSEAMKYAVLYMHDGQMLFDADLTWNKQAWNLDDVLSDSCKHKALRKFIIVAIWNSGATRHADYLPQKPFEQLSMAERDTVIAQLIRAGRANNDFTVQSDHYLEFIVKELKPFIDQKYSVYTNSKYTYIAGSSMGGLISIYALCEYPEIFGGIACLSTHWTGTFTLENNPFPNAMLYYLKEKIPNARDHKIYYDYGDQTLDTLYLSLHKQVDDLMRIKGYDQTTWITRYFPGANHSEQSWNERVHIPLNFLLRK